jgi:threonine dehydrogenase-like Zn-dependent dehydrogenase
MTAITAKPISATTRTMQAAVITAPHTVEVRTVELPTPGPKQLRFRLEGCGVCASNIPPWEGRPWFNYPMIPGALGHEAWGFVDAIGSDVNEFEIGDRVATLSQGGYAEFDLATPEMAVRLPQSLDGQPFPAEPLGCAMNIFRRSNVRAGETVAIIGIGFLGALLTRLAKNIGVRVIAISRRRASLNVARCMGADKVIQLDDSHRAIHEVAKLTNGSSGYEVSGFCDCVFECAGTQSALDLAAEICGVRGRLIIAGYHQDGPRQTNMQLWNWRGLDVINAHERDPAMYRRGMLEAVAAVESGQLDPRPLFTHRFPLSQLHEALELTRVRPAGFIKALITFDQPAEGWR